MGFNKNSNKIDSLENEEIDPKVIFNFFIRNKIFIGSVSLIFFLVACIYSFFPRKIWEGRFQIVLSTEEKSSGFNLPNNSLSTVLNIVNKDLKTEVGILESPSLLIPIYDYVISQKDSKKLNFAKWKKNLNIKLQDGTSILNIVYKDYDRDLILPVLKKMTNAYQDYSGKRERRFIELQKDYLTKQIDIFKNQSSESLKVAQEYAIDQDLNFLYLGKFVNLNNVGGITSSLGNRRIDNLGSLMGNKFSSEGSSSNLEIENIRVNSANKIRKIDLQVNQINELGDDLEKLQFIGSSIPGFSKDEVQLSLIKLEEKLIDARSKYTEADPLIISLKEKRDEIIKLLKDRAIGFLKAQRNEAEARMNAAMRPKGVILRYKELIRNAQRDEATLINLENDLRILELEEAKSDDPWELITNPTLKDYPVWPSKKNIGLIGLFIGLVAGTSISIYRENKSGKIFEKDTLEKLLHPDFVQNLDVDDLNIENEKIFFISNFISSQKGNKVCLIFLDQNLIDQIEKLKNLLLKEKINKEIVSVSSLKELKQFKKDDIKIFACSISNISSSQIENMKKVLMILDTNLSGLVLFNKIV